VSDLYRELVARPAIPRTAVTLVRLRDYPEWSFEVGFSDDDPPLVVEIQIRPSMHLVPLGEDRVRVPGLSTAEVARRRSNGEKAAWVSRFDPTQGGITARWLRALPFGRVVDEARQSLIEQLESALDEAERGGDGYWGRMLEGDDRDWAVWAERFSSRPGRRGRSDLDYARIAQLYVAQDPKRPVADMAGILSLNSATVANLVYECRRRGLLSAASSGRAGGELTERARELLAVEGRGI
jgi:hypothetical protein